ncbi:MAG: hypothetical protein WC100_16870 [Sterolibacterium sp.]
MATETVANRSTGILEQGIDDRLMFVEAIVDLMGSADPARVGNHSVANAACAVGHLLREIENIRQQLRPERVAA